MAGFSIFTDLITPTKYNIPDAPQLNLDEEMAANNKTNAASFEGAKTLATNFNDFMRAQVDKSLKAGIPGYADISSTLAKNLASQLRGELTPSQAAATQRSSAARALGLGLGGSPAGAGLQLRDLGLTQYGVQQTAQSQVPGYLSSMRSLTAAPMFDFANVFLTPQQRLATSMWNKENQWNVQNMKNQMKVQPDPWEKALAGLGDSILNYAGSAFSPSWGVGGTASKTEIDKGPGSSQDSNTEMSKMFSSYFGS